MLTIFTLSGGRSGTLFLSEIFKNNVRNCSARHEPYFEPGNPTLFGKPIYYNTMGSFDKLHFYFRKKRSYINKCNAQIYFEANHGFIKSMNKLANEYFPDAKFIHLVRDPLIACKSMANREAWMQKYHMPFRNYPGDDGKKYFRWSLTGKEPIYDSFKSKQLPRFQHYVIEWIEIENRIQQLLKENEKKNSCMTIHVPDEINDKRFLQKMMRFLNLETFNNEIILSTKKNRTPGIPTVISSQDKKEFMEVVNTIPKNHLEIFKNPPYSHFSWSEFLF